MPANNQHLHEIIKKIQARHTGTDAMAVTATAINIWEQLGLKFMPMIGPGSVSLMYMRSLASNKSAFPWLPEASPPGVGKSPFAALKKSLEGRQPAEVIAANAAILDTFINLLATFIGVRLTIQLLRSAFPHDAPQESIQEDQE